MKINLQLSSSLWSKQLEVWSHLIRWHLAPSPRAPELHGDTLAVPAGELPQGAAGQLHRPHRLPCRALVLHHFREIKVMLAQQ